MGPQCYVGGLAAMAMASWMNHEEKSVAKIKKLMAKDKNESLMIQAELADPMALISVHQ